MKYTHLLFLLMSILCFSTVSSGKTTLVSSHGELKKALSKLKAGDTLELSEGTWESVEISISAKGTEEKPIVIKGAPDGKTVIAGRSWVGIGGRHITVSDLYFRGVEPPEGMEGIMTFRDARKREAENGRLTNCVFESCNPRDPIRRYKWVQLYGRENRVDHNLFANQRHNGVAIQVRMSTADAQHRIDHNHFVDRPEGDGNGFEMIQVGQSQDSEKVGSCLIDSNLFERCDGEIEIISNKTCGNTYRGNVFIESAGTLTLRHGNDCLVEGNVFIGKGKKGSSGLRIIGTGHTVRNNYFEGLYGRTGGVIVFYTGIEKSPLNGYFAAHDVSVENNLLVNSLGTGMYLIGGYGERGRTILPTGIEIRKNLIHLSGTEAPQVVGDLPDVQFAENIVTFGKEVDRTDMNGLVKKKLTLARGERGLFDVFDESGEPAFHYDETEPQLLNRSEVGPSWFTVIPKLSVLNPAQVGRVVRGDTEGFGSLVDDALSQADAIIEAGRTYSVTANERVPPSGDVRAYYSTGPYWWANPDTEDGLPYVRRDGEFNPERDLVSDRAPLHAMVADVWTLTMAYHASGDERYALFAQQLIRVWFLDDETGMLPNLNHAQAIPGKTDGRGTGIIDTLVFVELMDALRLLEDSYTWSLDEQTALRDWFSDYLEWLTFHPNGIDECASKNNHGTAYDLQQLAIADYLGETNLAAMIIERVKSERIDTQITPEGLQPLEYKRTRSWSYCTENLEHFARLAVIARQYGQNLFQYRSAEGANLLTALNFLLPHARDPEATWPGEQVTEFQFEYLYATVSILSGFVEDPKILKLLEQMPVPQDALLSELMK
ncbi:MAG: chondroitinase-B domain-containing protein [Opitutaceae bacterium]